MSAKLSLTKPEILALERHRICLSQKREQTVPIEAALEDWLCHYSSHWRAMYHRESLALQQEEMLRHKWIESEKAQRDLGNEAIFDWIKNHAAQWRSWYEYHCNLELRTEDISS